MRSWRRWGAAVLGVALGLGTVLGGAAPARAQGDADVAEAMQLNQQATSLYRAGKYDDAIQLAHRALAVFERALGPDHPNVASALNNLALSYEAKGEYGRAEPLYLRALAIREKTLGPDRPDVAIALSNLAGVYRARGEVGRAEPLFQRALAIMEKALPPNHPDVATALNNLALLYVAKGEYGRAEPLFQRALAICEQAQGPDHLEVATPLVNLAELYRERGEYDRAEPLYQRALAVFERALGPDHPLVATALNNLGLLYKLKGAYDRAEPLHLRALAIREKTLGPDHPDVAASLSNLASLYKAKGEYGRAEPLDQRALAIRERALGPERLDVAHSLNDLAELYRLRGEHERAEPLYQRALAIYEKALGPDHPLVTHPLNNLAVMYVQRGEYDRAEPLHQRALAIREKALGPDHPDVATSLNNLAELYRLKGEYGRAEPLYQRALAVFERALGPDHPDVATALDNLATLCWAAGRVTDAVRYSRRAQEVEERTLALLLSAGSEAQNLIYVNKSRGTNYSDLSLALRVREPESAALALTSILRMKGRGLDATAGSLRAVRAHLGPEVQRLLDELGAERARYATLVMHGAGKTPLPTYQGDLAALRSRIDDHEAAISKRSAAFRAQQQPVTVAGVQGALPEGAVLVEWTAYSPFDPSARTAPEKWGPFRYAACVLPKRDAPACVDLGDVRAIDADVQTLRTAFRRPGSSDVSTLSRALEARVMAPVRALLGDTRHVFLSPDGALNLVPFAALIGDDGHPLIERYAFTYLTSGRDLLRLSAHVPPQQGPLILAAPDFDAGAAPGAGRFSPLLHAGEEAVAASHVLRGATVLLHDEATKAVLRKAHGPTLLHIGTHGYFEPIGCSAQADQAALANPLLRSGIALAGANACANGHDEGLLTAFEAASLDLYGTQLAVLSACQTGVGDAKAGDGVYGLRRALVLAGAETQVMTLWPVDGAPTAAVMKAYYERLGRGEGRSEAMRQVQLDVLHTSGREHPYYWAPFIVSGDERALDLRVHPGGACACDLGREAPDGGATWLAVAVVLLWMARRTQRVAPRRATRCGMPQSLGGEGAPAATNARRVQLDPPWHEPCSRLA